MAQRLTHAERKEQTRTGLVASARRVFLDRGFHGASLDEIADAAGYSKGAVYSNFAGKDDLFLAVLDAHLAQRARVLTDLVHKEQRLAGAYHAVARAISEADASEPRWTPLLLEFWTYASRHEALRSIAREHRERFLGVVANLIEELGARHELAFAIPAKEIARGSAALARGMALERLLNPAGVSAALFEQMHTAYVNGLTRPLRDIRPARSKGGKHDDRQHPVSGTRDGGAAGVRRRTRRA